ncbi:MAG: AAA family ATPase [Gammaproteobacteria bacterium]|jgi:ATP-dependent 26S proteasome regulatory subunit|nr:AAA family ATPase [Gammaproteobacteria bacterium]
MTASATLDAPERRLRKGLLAHNPLFYALCREEDRLEALLGRVASDHYGRPVTPAVWTMTRGLAGPAGTVEGTRDALAVLRHIASAPDGIYLLEDFPDLFDDPAVVRGLRDLYRELASRDSYVVLSHSQLRVPDALSHQLYVVELGLPSEEEIYQQLQALVEQHALWDRVSDEWVSRCVTAMRGMALNEIRHLFLRLVGEGKLDLAAALPEIHDEKAAALIKEACLKFIPHAVELRQVGGLDNLKEWVTSRRSLFTREAIAAGVPLPAGVLFMGVSGCGKSMAAKVIAGAWQLPLVRLDMNLVLSGAYGSAEYAFDHALRVAETMAPLVLWIDEMENSFGYDEGGTGTNANIFSSFLTWMQEKPGPVFVVATANRIQRLPAEVIRKGRFDQLFFLDLPTDEERRAILAIHIAAHGGDPEQFNLPFLIAATKGWSGAEIEQAIKGAVIKAYAEGRSFTHKDVTWNTARMVPLSRTMEEPIKQLRQWSQTRATPASRKEGAAA